MDDAVDVALTGRRVLVGLDFNFVSAVGDRFHRRAAQTVARVRRITYVG